MAGKVTWGILGCARIARRGLIPGIQQSQRGDLVAIASRDRDKAAAWAAEFAIPTAYGSYEALLDDPRVRAVYIPLPNELHAPWTIRAAAAGKHVLCDKPLARDPDEADQMIAACRSAGVRLMEGYMWRHHPRTVRSLDLLRGGTIGELRLVRASFSFDIDRGDWRLDPRRGGGALWDIGGYGINAARLFCGAEPTAVEAFARWHATGVDMTLTATLQFPEGVLAQVDCSFELPYRCHIELLGTRGAIELPRAFLPGDRPQIIIHRENDTESLELGPCPSQYAEMIDGFCHSIDAGKLLVPAEDGGANTRVLHRVLTSAGNREFR
jgi:predicted dehydrogenase